MRLYSVEVGATYSIAARYRFSTGRAGSWSSAKLHEVTGPTLPPPDIVAVFIDSEVIRVRYDNPDPDHAGYRWHWSTTTGASWANSEALTDSIVLESYIEIAALPLATREVLVRPETRSGLLSTGIARLAITPGSLIQRMKLYEEQLGGDGLFPGVVEGGDVGSTMDLEADDTNIWLAPPDARWLSDLYAPWLDPQWKRLAWITATRLGAQTKSTDRIFIEVEASIQPHIIYRWGEQVLVIVADDEVLPESLLDQPDDVLLGTLVTGESLNIWRPYRNGIAVVPGERLQVQFSIQGGGGARPAITSARMIVDAAEIEEVIPDIAIPADGLIVPLQKPFRAIRYVLGTIHAGGDAVQMLIDSKAMPPNGPVIHLETAARARTSGHVDLRIGGV